MKHKTKTLLTITFLFISLSSADSAEPLQDEVQKLKTRLEQLEKKLATQETRNTEQDNLIENHTGVVKKLQSVSAALGNLEFSLGATSVVQGTVNNGDNYRRTPGIDQKGDDADVSYSVDFEIGAPIGKNGQAFIHIEAGEGDGLNDEVSGLTGVNADALGDSVDLEMAELWYEHSFMAGKIITTVGKLDPVGYFDANEVANDETSQFLADQFVNNIAVDFPDYTYGLRLSWFPADWFELNLGALESDSDYEDIFHDSFLIAEAVFKTKIRGLVGNYRFYAWGNYGDHEKIRDPLQNSKNGQGFGLSFDQQLSENITGFCRYGQQTNDIYAIERAWSAGFQVAGRKWSREDDTFGLAFGVADITSAYRDIELRQNGFGITPAEKRIEAYYRFHVNDQLAISPDFQWVDGLAGSADADSVAIFGVRAQLDF